MQGTQSYSDAAKTENWQGRWKICAARHRHDTYKDSVDSGEPGVCWSVQAD